MAIDSYRELIVWQKSMEMVTELYKMTENFPRAEMYGITSQMRRAAISIPSNIAEGRCRGTRKDFRHFISIAYGSGAELETQIEIAKRLEFAAGSEYEKTEKLLDEVMRMLNKMLSNLKV